jgi:transcription elongation factor Elf1
MWLTSVEPGDDPEYDKRTFECLSCEHQEAVVVKYR